MKEIVLSNQEIHAAWALAKKHPQLALGFKSASPIALKAHAPLWLPSPGDQIPAREALYRIIALGPLDGNSAWPWMLCAKRALRARSRDAQFATGTMPKFSQIIRACCALLCDGDSGSAAALTQKGEELSLIPPMNLLKAHLAIERINAHRAQSGQPGVSAPSSAARSPMPSLAQAG